MTIVELTPVELFAISVFALQFTGLTALAIHAARQSWAAAPTGERVMWIGGLFALAGIPALLALRAMG